MDDEKPIRHPRQTSALVGHGAAEELLRDACLSERMAHGWLFAGPRGVGKATLAYRLARFMFSRPVNVLASAGEAGQGNDLAIPDGSDVARLVGNGAHPDLHVLSSQPAPEEQTDAKKPISARGEIKIAQVRALSRALTTTAGAGGARVCIVDAADELNRNAANALLKNLEEPPANTFFLLIAHRPARVLPTLRSRCRRLDLARLPRQAVASILTDALGEAAETDREAIIDLANGSAGDALRLAGEGGLDLAREILGLAQSLPGLDARRLHTIAARLAPARADPQFRLFAELLLEWIADLVTVSGTGQASRFGAGGAALAARLAHPNQLEPWAALWENLTQSLSQTLALNLDRKQFLLNAFFALAATQRATSTA